MITRTSIAYDTARAVHAYLFDSKAKALTLSMDRRGTTAMSVDGSRPAGFEVVGVYTVDSQVPQIADDILAMEGIGV